MLEEFKNGLPDKVVVYQNEQKVISLPDAAVFADKFVLTHKIFSFRLQGTLQQDIMIILNMQYLPTKMAQEQISL